MFSRTAQRYVHRGARSSRRSCRSHKHTLAISRSLPDSFIDAVSDHHSTTATNDEVSLTQSRKQHDDYIKELRRHVPTICLPALENHPDCLFVEDTIVAVAYSNSAVITSMGHESRKGEADTIKDIVAQLGIHIHDMRNDEKARCDGGDIMYTGRHLFVGLSRRTNQEGFEFLKRAFVADNELNEGDVIAVPPVVAGKNVLHLKSAVTHIDERTLLAPEGPIGDAVLDTMGADTRGYEAIRLPDVLSCNAVVVNGHVIAQDSECDESRRRISELCDRKGLGLSFVDTSELAKKDAALTCCSILLSI